jgi:hypothetical protein
MDNNAREIFLKNLIYGENKNAKWTKLVW